MYESFDLNETDCEELLRAGLVGRVAACTPNGPHIIPVNYSVVDDAIVLRTTPYSLLGSQVRGTVLALEVDQFDYERKRGWSVVVQGASRVVTDLSERNRVRRLIVDPWAVDGTADRTVRITSTLISGRRFERHPSRPAPSGPARRPEAYAPPRRRRAAPDQGQED